MLWGNKLKGCHHFAWWNRCIEPANEGVEKNYNRNYLLFHFTARLEPFLVKCFTFNLIMSRHPLNKNLKKDSLLKNGITIERFIDYSTRILKIFFFTCFKSGRVGSLQIKWFQTIRTR